MGSRAKRRAVCGAGVGHGHVTLDAYCRARQLAYEKKRCL